MACPLAELFAYLVARAQLVHEHIQPLLEKNAVILLDRFYHSTIAYQSHALQLDYQEVQQAIDIALNGVRPDAVWYLRITADVAQERRGGDRDRIEARGLAYLEQVAAGYDALAERGEVTAIDATLSVEDIHEKIWDDARRTLGVT